MSTHDDLLLDYVFEPIAAWATKNLGIGCFVLGNIFLALALMLLVYAGVVWWSTAPPHDFLTWSFIVPLVFTAALIINIAVYVAHLENKYWKHLSLRPVQFRKDALLYWHRFFAFVSAVTLGLWILVGRHELYTQLWEASPIPTLIGLYFLSCTRFLPEPKQQAAHVS